MIAPSEAWEKRDVPVTEAPWMIYHQQKDATRGWNRIICLDHRNTHAIVLDAVSYARFPLTEGQEVHREHMSVYSTHEARPRYSVRLIDVSHQEEEELVFANLTRNGLTAYCRLAEAFQYIQLGKADRLLI